jgi:hypothetical protein
MARTVLCVIAFSFVTNGALACAPQRPLTGDPNGPYGKPMPEDTHDENMRKAIEQLNNQPPRR